MYNHQDYINKHKRQNKPTFRVGDWVDYIYGAKEPHRASKPEVESYSHAIKIWKPEPNEWCWFWNGIDKNTPVLSRFAHMAIGGYATTGFYITPFDYCEPFIGTLPTTLKD